MIFYEVYYTQNIPKDSNNFISLKNIDSNNDLVDLSTTKDKFYINKLIPLSMNDNEYQNLFKVITNEEVVGYEWMISKLTYLQIYI